MKLVNKSEIKTMTIIVIKKGTRLRQSRIINKEWRKGYQVSKKAK